MLSILPSDNSEKFPIDKQTNYAKMRKKYGMSEDRYNELVREYEFRFQQMKDHYVEQEKVEPFKPNAH